MNQPEWRDFVLEAGTLPEATAEGGRIVVWLPTDRDASFHYWERIANVPRGDVRVEEGLCMTAATSIRARQRAGGLVGRLWNRLREPNSKRDFLLPDGTSAEQCGERQTNLALVWPEANGSVLDETRIKSQWPQATRCQKLGNRLFLVCGLESQTGDREPVRGQAPLPPTDNPRGDAEAILAAARQMGARDKEATALTDLGAIALNEGDPKGAIASLERALAIAVQLRDTHRESDVLGNLGMAMLMTRQPARAQSMFERELAYARAAGDRFAEKFALERLGLSSWHQRDFSGALGFFDQALELARRLGDRHQEANLLWHQAIQLAELGQRERAIATAEESIALFRTLGRPQADSYGAYLQKYRMGLVDDASAVSAMGVTVDRSPQSYLGGSIVASVMAGQSHAEPAQVKGASGPGLLRMALSATKAMAGFAGSGFKTTPTETLRKRLQTCAGCEHHTGVRCKICGCLTQVKSRMLHEDCPIGKWPA